MTIPTDTPKELIQLLEMIDFSKLDENSKNRIPELEKLANIHIPDRGYKPKLQWIAITGCPKEIEDLLIKKDFSRVGTYQKMLVLPLIRIWIKKNLPVKYGVL